MEGETINEKIWFYNSNQIEGVCAVLAVIDNAKYR